METIREVERRLRSEGHSRSEAKRIAATIQNQREVYDMKDIKEDISKLSNGIFAIDSRCAAEDREPTAKEKAWRAEAQAELDHLRKSLPVDGPLTLQNGPLGGQDVRAIGGARGYALLGPKDKKDFRSLYGAEDGYRWPGKDGDSFFSAVFSGRHDPRLIRAGMTETVPSDGGFLVPTQYAEKIHAVSLENEIIMPRCFVQPMKSNDIKIPAMNVGNHSSNLYGGFTASYTAEAGTINEADPKVRSMNLNAK